MLQETVVMLCVLCVQYNYRNRGSLTFEPLTLVPIQVKMMDTELLTEKEVRNNQWYFVISVYSTSSSLNVFIDNVIDTSNTLKEV